MAQMYIFQDKNYQRLPNILMSLCRKGVKRVSANSQIFSTSTNHVKHNIFGSSNRVTTLTPNLTKQVKLGRIG